LVSEYQKLTPKKIQEYSEADTRRIFIMPLFHALGWDTLSRDEVAEEVKVATGRVDFVFKLNGVSQFYLETKALRADLTRADYQKQAITYAYNKGITWALLSDFEGLQVINAQTGRPFITLSCDNYVRDFEDLWLLSKDSFQTNALNESAEKYGALPQRLAIEQRLYNQLRQWREELYNQIHAYNKGLKHNQIDEVIQRLFNRLIFIRNCEDRQIEDRVLLGAVNEWRGSGRKEELIERLQVIFRDFDGYYDSDLFTYHMTDEVFIEGVTIEHIIDGLYEVPGGIANYDFSVIDADVLGAVYEQYLGHVADVVKRKAKEAQSRMDFGFPVEETFELTAKKQRRKEHGIYYTPKFITDYIVKETVGRFLQERTHDEILNLKILDPACGSGSFLIRAYDELLNYHSYQKSKPVNELDQWERLSILTGSIFGVDLDMQAVEIAHLNLLLRSLAKRELLPSLKNNIRQGNSLISGTEKELKKYFGNKWRDKKPLIWEEEFKDIMANGGFDIVIGNPPYVSSLELSKDTQEKTKGFFKDKYESAIGNFDLYILFLEIAIELVKDHGFLSFIIPNKFLVNDYGTKIREIILQNKIVEILDVSELDVFKDSAVYPVILIVKKEIIDEDDSVKVGYAGTEWTNISYKTGNQVRWLNTDNNIISLGFSSEKDNLLSKIENSSTKLKESAKVLSGTTGFDYTKYGKLISINKEKKHIKFVVTSNIEPYYINWGKKIHYLKKSFQGAYFNVESKEVSEGRRRLYKNKNKILVRGMSKRLIAGIDYEGFALAVGVYAITKAEYDNRYILGILNSKVIDFYYKAKFESKHLAGGYLSFNVGQLEQIPIFTIDLNIPTQKKLHDDLVALVEKIHGLYKSLNPIRDIYSNERDELVKEIEKTDKEINNLVYNLYGLTEKERKIIEEVA